MSMMNRRLLVTAAVCVLVADICALVGLHASVSSLAAGLPPVNFIWATWNLMTGPCYFYVYTGNPHWA